MVTATRPTDAEIWGWLDTVPDPEIPAISLVDLGVIRALLPGAEPSNAERFPAVAEELAERTSSPDRRCGGLL